MEKKQLYKHISFIHFSVSRFSLQLQLVLAVLSLVWRMETYPGPFCKSLGLSEDHLREFKAGAIQTENITNGLILELRTFYDGRFPDIFKCLSLLNPNCEQLNAGTLNSRIHRLCDVKRKLRAKKKVKEFRTLQEFIHPYSC